jgi:hypothetical protein
MLIRGIEPALQQEIYDAGDLLYRWTRTEGSVAESVFVSVRRTRGSHSPALQNGNLKLGLSNSFAVSRFYAVSNFLIGEIHRALSILVRGSAETGA